MVEAVTTLFRCLALLLVLPAVPSAVFAHRLDEYLQATLVSIEPGEIRLEINLTPGVAIAGQVLALIDRDHDGVISTNEAAAYAGLLKRDLRVLLDHREIYLNLTAINFPAPAELRTGWGIIQIEFRGKLGLLVAGSHRIAIENRHLPALSVYLLNAALSKSADIHIARQSRNDTQGAGEIEFIFHQPAGSFSALGIVAALAVLLAALHARAGRAVKRSPSSV